MEESDSQNLGMKKETIVKGDGRYLIYFTFEAPTPEPSPNASESQPPSVGSDQEQWNV